MIGARRAALAAACATSLLAGCGSARQASLIPRQLLAEARPIGPGAHFRPPVSGQPIGPCTQRLGPRFGVHVELFAANRVVLVPTGIGTLPPRTFAAGRVAGAHCFGDLVTIDPTGLVLVRPGSRTALADLFRSWGEPLTAHRLASFGGRVSLFVEGRPWTGRPGDVPLTRHAEIVLEVGPHVPPHSSYVFPLGL